MVITVHRSSLRSNANYSHTAKAWDLNKAFWFGASMTWPYLCLQKLLFGPHCECNVHDLCGHTSQLSQSKLSYHITALPP
eukprot:scaffold3256_cov19-Prasinocladus_malaysianus.AAC.1